MQPRFMLVRFILLCLPTLCLSSSSVPLALGGDTPEVVHIDAQTACPDGIALHGPHTTVSFASLFPVGGPLDLRGGTLLLEQDLHAASGSTLHTVGIIEGNNHLLSLPSSSEQLLPVTHCCSGVKKVFPCEMPESVGALAWQQNHESPLLGAVGNAADGSLLLGSIENERFIINQQLPLPASGRLISWAPFFDGGIVGVEPHEEGSSLQFFSCSRDGAESVLIPIDEHQGTVTAASWDATGGRVAVALYHEGSASVVVYRLIEGVLERAATIAAPGSAKIYDLAWNAEGTRLAAGLGYALGQPELITYEVTEGALVQAAVTSIAAHVSSVSYFPAVAGEEERLVVGLAGGGGAERIRLYVEDGPRLVSPLIGGQYPVAHDIYDMSWSPDGNLLGIVAHTGFDNEGVKETAVVMYERRGNTLYKRLSHAFAVPRYQVGWAPVQEPTIMALDSDGGVTQLTLHECMTVRNATVRGSAAARWQVPFHTEGQVVWESASNGSVAFDKGVRVAPGSRFTVRNSLVTGEKPLAIRGDSSGEVVFEGCSIPRLGLKSRVPVHFNNQVRLSGAVSGSLYCGDGATVQLSADTMVQGILTIEGEVMIKGQGHQLDVDNMLLVIKPGSSLTLRDVTVEGLYSEMLKIAEDGVLAFDRGTCVCFDEVVAERGTITLKQQAVVYKGVSHKVSAAQYVASEGNSLVAVARARSISASNVSDSSNPSAKQKPPVVMPQQPVNQVVTPVVTPVGGAIPSGKIISSATFTLTNDVVASLQAPLTITKNCTVYGSGRTVSCQVGAAGIIRVAPGVQVQFQRTHFLGISPQSVQLGEGSSIVWGDGTVLSFGSGGELTQNWCIQGAVSLFGNGTIVHMREGGGLRIEDESTLLLDSLTLSGVAGYAISMMGLASSLMLSNTDIQLYGNWIIDQGSVQVRYDSTIRGPHTLLYSSDAQSIIAQHATLRLADDLYFSYQPAGRRNDRFIAEGAQASLYIDGATLGTSDAAWHYVQGRLLLGGTLEGFGGGIVLVDQLGQTKANLIQRQPVVHWAGSVAL